MVFIDFWKGFLKLPSAWLLLLQFLVLILSALSIQSTNLRAITWLLGVMLLLIIAKVIRQTPVFTILGLSFVGGAVIFSSLFILGQHDPTIQIIAHSFEAASYFCAVYGLLRYMFADRFVTKDELFAAAAVFTLMAWGFAFLYSICQLLVPNSFMGSDGLGSQNWLNLLFLSFSIQSATGLSDILPKSAPARVLAILQMFCGVMYLAIIVTRLIALHYISYKYKRENKS